jgi:hypothetical protein
VTQHWKILAGFGLFMFGSGLYWGYELAQREQPEPVAEAAKPAERQQDGSLVLERSATDEKVKVPVTVPEGAVVERVVYLRVQPERRPPEEADLSDEALIADYNSLPPCPEVEVALALAKMPDDTRRVIATARNGKVVGGLDIPAVPPITPRTPLANAAGLTLRMPSGKAGVFYDRDLGPFRLGAELVTPALYSPPLSSLEIGARVGIRF